MRLPGRNLLKLSVALAVVGLLSGAAWWWRFTSTPGYRLQKGREALQRGDRDEAERLAQLLLAGGNGDHAHLLRGEALYLQKQYDRALAELDRIRDKGELRVEAALLSGQCLLRENQPEQAVRHFQFVLHHRPESADAHRCLAEIYYTQGALMRAVEHAQQWGDLDSYDGRPWWMMGHVYKSLNNLPDAIEKYAEALHRALPADKVQEVRSELAECLVERKMWTEALQILEGADASTARELQIKCLALRVQSLWGLGRSEEARALLDQGLANHPLGVDLLRVGSEVRMADRQLEGAATLLLQALEIDRHDFTSRYRLAMAYEGLGRKADAEEQRRLAEQTKSVLAEVSKLNDAAAANPWDAASRVRLAALCEELGQREMARMWREAAKACAAGAAP